MAGGKLTGYRKMAERLVNLLARNYSSKYENKNPGKVITNEIPLGGEIFRDAAEVTAYQKEIEGKIRKQGYGVYDAWYLTSNYGKQTDKILEMMDGSTLLQAEARYTMKYELARTLCDFFIRRTGRLYFDINSVKEGYREIAELMSKELNWDSERKEHEIRELLSNVDEVSKFT
jgi:glycerol-3-phosphate dehydrogenase